MWSAMPWLWREKLCLAHSRHLKSSSDLLAPKPTQLSSVSITIRKFHISWKRTSGLFGRGYDVVILLCKSVLICTWSKIHQLDMSRTNWSTSLLVFSMPWFSPLILLTLPKSPSACKIFTKPLPWDNQVTPSWSSDFVKICTNTSRKMLISSSPDPPMEHLQPTEAVTTSHNELPDFFSTSELHLRGKSCSIVVIILLLVINIILIILIIKGGIRGQAAPMAGGNRTRKRTRWISPLLR